MRKSITFTKRIYTFFLLVSILSGTLPILAQTRRSTSKAGSSQVAANQPKQTAQKCSGAWTGVVTYTRTQINTNNKTVQRVSGRGEDKTDWEMKYDYKATVAVVESPEKNGSSLGKANINHSMTSTEKVTAKEKNSCDRGKTWREMTGDSVSKTETTGNAERVDANFHVGVNADGTYSISVALPQIQGKTTGSQTSTYSGHAFRKKEKI